MPSTIAQEAAIRELDAKLTELTHHLVDIPGVAGAHAEGPGKFTAGEKAFPKRLGLAAGRGSIREGWHGKADEG